MNLKHLSASSAKLYLACPKAWHARYILGGQAPSGAAADLGSTIHKSMERWAEAGYWKEPSVKEQWLAMSRFFEEDWSEMMGLRTNDYDEGRALLEAWVKRQDWTGRTVLSAERERTFLLELSARKRLVPFIYIIDLLEEVNGEVRVRDYKSGRWMLDHEGLRGDTQARSYATAVWLEHPDQERYWVTFDYLRGDPIGVAFTAAECQAHYDSLCALAGQILDDDDPEETLNSDCRFCIRKTSCKAILAHGIAGGPLAQETAVLVTQRVELTRAMTAIKSTLAQVDGLLAAEFEADETLDILTGLAPDDRVEYTSKGQRVVDMGALRRVLTPEELAGFAKKATLKDLENFIGGLPPGDDRAAQLRKAVIRSQGKPSIKVAS